MAKQTINVGVIANDRKGDPIRIAFQKTNNNFTELYTNIASLSDVAISGSYTDLSDIPAGGDRLISGVNELVLSIDGNLSFPNGHLIGTGEGDMVIQSAGGVTLAHTTGTPFSWDSSIGIYSNAITMFSGNGAWNFANDGVLYGPLMGGLKVAGYIEAAKGNGLTLSAGAPTDTIQTVQLTNVTNPSDIIFIDLSTYPNAASIPVGAIFSPTDNPDDDLTVIFSSAGFDNLWELRLSGIIFTAPNENYTISYPSTNYNNVTINTQSGVWAFDSSGSLILPSGSIINETASTISITPPAAGPGQSLIIRPTAAGWNVDSSGFISYGNPITVSVTLLTGMYFGTINYEITGPGVTEQSLGRPLTGKLTFVGIPGADTQNVTWTIPSLSDITEFTFTVTSVDGTRSTDIQTENDPALYYNFELNALPVGYFVTVTVDNITNLEFSHIHLVSGNSTTVDLYLGDDDQFVKIEKNGGNVVVGTNANTKNWTFGNNGDLDLPIDGGIVFDRNNTSIRVGMGFHITSGEGISIESIDQSDLNNLIYRNWYFAPTGLIQFPDNSIQTTAWAGGRVVDVPVSSIGVAGDKQGDIAFDGSYIYYCIQDFTETSYSTTIVSTYSGVYPSIVKGSIPQPQAGWTFIHNGTTYTLASNAVENNPGEWTCELTTSISVTAGDSVTVGNAFSANVWKRVAWSTDTW